MDVSPTTFGNGDAWRYLVLTRRLKDGRKCLGGRTREIAGRPTLCTYQAMGYAYLA